MSCDLEPASPGRVFRIGRQPDPWAYPDWAEAGEDGTFGNRWDDPESSYRVLYACSQRLGAFVETLSRFRPDPEVIAGLAEIEGEDAEDPALPPGHVPRGWLDGRLIAKRCSKGSTRMWAAADRFRTSGGSWLPESFTTASMISTARPFG